MIYLAIAGYAVGTSLMITIHVLIMNACTTIDENSIKREWFLRGLDSYSILKKEFTTEINPAKRSQYARHLRRIRVSIFLFPLGITCMAVAAWASQNL
jgi:hypothetical protein